MQGRDCEHEPDAATGPAGRSPAGRTQALGISVAGREADCTTTPTRAATGTLPVPIAGNNVCTVMTTPACRHHTGRRRR